MREYPFKPLDASNGDEFANLCVRFYREHLGLKLTLCPDRKSQFEFGDTFEGPYEFKELKNSHHRLHIEIAENNDRSTWWPSGIYAQNKARFFVCGSHVDVWGFWRHHLVAFHQKKRPREVWYGGGFPLSDSPFDGATIRSFVLEKAQAETFFRERFTKTGDEWALTFGPLTTLRQLGLDQTIGPYH